MEGKNVRTPEQQEEIENQLFPIMEGIVKLIFPEGKLSKTELKEGQGRVLKIHVDEVGSDELLALSGLVRDKGMIVCLKRSGTGITIVITFKEI